MAGDQGAARIRSAALALVAIAALACALRAPVASLPFERDEGEYAYIAQRWFAGDVPYRDAFDQKPPGIFAFYAAAFATFGESEAALRWAAQLWTLVGLGAIALLGARLATPGAGIAAALAGVACSAAPDWFNNAVNTEQVALTPLAVGGLAALTAATRGRAGAALAVGALGAVALLLKPVVLPIVAYQIATALWPGGRRAARALAVALGLLTPLFATALWFAAHDAWQPLLDAVVWSNLAYASSVPLAEYPINFAKGISWSLAALGPIFAAAVAAPLLVRVAGDGRSALRRVGWLVGWLLASLLAVSAGGYYRVHYFLLAVPPLALLAGIGVDALARRVLGSRPAAQWAGVAAAAALLAWSVASSWWYFGPSPGPAKLHRLYGMNPFPEAPGLGAWIGANAKPEDRVFVYGSEPQLLFYAERQSATRFIYLYPLTMAFPDAAERQREVLAAFDAAPPRWVAAPFIRFSLLESSATPPALRRGLRERLERDYDLVALVPYLEDRSTRVLEYGAARAAWDANPLWDDAMPWAAFGVWKRRD